jgi:hypothetical protein
MDELAKLMQALEFSHAHTIEMNMHIDNAIEASPEVNGNILVPVTVMRALQDVLSMDARLLAMTGTTLSTLIEIIRKATEE